MENNSTNLSSSFKILDTVSSSGHGGQRMPKNTMRVYYIDKQYRVYFSQDFSESITNDGFDAVQLAFNDITGEFALVFNKENKGHILRIRSGRKLAITVNSYKLTETIAKAYDAKKGSILEFGIGKNQSRRPEIRFHALEFKSVTGNNK